MINLFIITLITACSCSSRLLLSPDNSDGFVGFGESCTLSVGNAELIAEATGVGIDIVGELVGLIPYAGAFGSAAIDIARDPAVDAIEQAIKDGAIICEEGLWCCNNICQYLKTDWAGFKYCPFECKAGADCPNGSCGDNRQEGESCDCPAQCSGNMHCCHGECRRLERDWVGVEYCPQECRGGFNCGPGTCPGNRGSGQSCSCSGQCLSGCCEGGRCVNKKRDWAGFYYCPAECVGDILKGAGSC